MRPETRAEFTRIRRNTILGTRNRLIPPYCDIDRDILLNTVTTTAPAVAEQFKVSVGPGTAGKTVFSPRFLSLPTPRSAAFQSRSAPGKPPGIRTERQRRVATKSQESSQVPYHYEPDNHQTILLYEAATDMELGFLVCQECV
jgi:hypothetical protein